MELPKTIAILALVISIFPLALTPLLSSNCETSLLLEQLSAKAPIVDREGGTTANARLPDLLSLWDELVERTSSSAEEVRPGGAVPSRTIIDAFPRGGRSIGAKDGIAILTHATPSKFPELLREIERWGGPASVGVYLRSRPDVESFLEFARDNAGRLRGSSFHVLMEDCGNATTWMYPHNLLRNLALENARTDYVLTMDVDFVTGRGYHDKIWNFVRSNREIQGLLRNKTLFVLPAFEHTNSFAGSPQEAVPKTREEVVGMVTNRTLQLCRTDTWPVGQGSTNYEAWCRNETQPQYRIQYNVGFEPYVLARRRGLPRYWPHFRGYGYNKYSWFMEAHVMGYQFYVLRDFFMVHLNHPVGYKKTISQQQREEMNRFRSYLVRSYGAKLKELKLPGSRVI